MKRSLLLLISLIVICVPRQSMPAQSLADDPHLGTLLQQFKTYSGAELVFQRDDLPEGRYHDVLKPLGVDEKRRAAEICVAEARMYPPNYFREVGLETVGVFAACASLTTTDRSRPFDRQLGGYRYFGVYNGTNAIAAAMYSEGQLALTFHHEIFHHVDSTVDGITESWQLSSDDAVYQGAISGLNPYTAQPIAGGDLEALRDRCAGFTLKDTVSEYAAKNSREDQAETARHVMSMLPDSLVQAIENPSLAGSQRILHVLSEYERSVPDGPGFDWFVDVALGRAIHDRPPEIIDALIAQLRSYATAGSSGFAGVDGNVRGARAALKAIVRINPAEVTDDQAAELVRLATRITGAILRQRIRPDNATRRFDVWGQEDADGVNHTLRHDLVQFEKDAKRLNLIASIHQRESRASADDVTCAQLKNLRLIARYFVFIRSNWSVTPGTRRVFDSTRSALLASLPALDTNVTAKLQSRELPELAWRITAEGRPNLQ